MGDRLNLGIVGINWRGADIKPAFDATGKIHVKALCSPRPEPLAEASQKLGVAETFTEGLLRARCERGAVRAGRLRALGDRALFLSGFFADSLERRGAGAGWVAEAGRIAYTDLSSLLSGGEVAWMRARLYRELAERFPQFAEVLTEVGDGLRTATPTGLVSLCARYLRLGREADRRRLVRRGLVVPEAGGRVQ